MFKMRFTFNGIVLLVSCVYFTLPNLVLGAAGPIKPNQGQHQKHYYPDLSNREDSPKQPSEFLTPPPSSVQSILFLNDSDSLGSGVREKRQEGRSSADARTFNVDIGIGPGGYPPGAIPLCFEREVSGTCRYRSSPDECFRHDWTAYATIVNEGYKKITSFPEGLVVFPGAHPRVRVQLTSSCCTPVVQFVAYDFFLQPIPCIVDVRELQNLHWGEIVGIVVGCILFFLVLIIIIVLCVRYQRRKRQKETVIFGRSLTRSKSGTGSMNHHR